MMVDSNFSDRIKEIRDAITSAKAVKKIKEDDLKKLIADAKELRKELKEKYNIDVNDLQTLYDEKKKSLEEKLQAAEEKLNEIKTEEDESE